MLIFAPLAAGEGDLGFGPAGFLVERKIGAWRSLVARSVRDRKAGGSNPLAPTTTIVSPETHYGGRFAIDLMPY